MNNRPSNVQVAFAAQDELPPSKPALRLHPRGRTTLLAGALAALVLVALGAIVPGQFLFTDHEHLVAHPAMHSWIEGLRTIWLHPRAMPQVSPLADSFLLVESQLFGARAAAFRAVSLVIHATNVVLLWLLLRRLTIPGALAAAALFAVLPVHAQTIAWAGQQPVLLSAAFYLGGLIWWVRSDGRGGWPALAMVASVLCHPMGLTFPLAAAALRRSSHSRAALGAMVLVSAGAAALLLFDRKTFDWSLDAFYLAYAALVTVVVVTVARLTPPSARTGAAIAAGVVVAGLAALAALRAPTFRSDDAYWQRALRANPRSVEALVQLGRVELRQRSAPRTASALFDTALRVDPNHRAALLELAAAHGAMGEWDRAVARYQQLLARDPRDADALFGLSIAYAQQDRTDDAIRAMQDVLRLRPGDGRAHRELSVLYRENGDTRRAREHGEQAIRLDPRRPEPYLELATLMLTRLGDVPRAQSLLEQARRLDPRRAETLRLAGQVQFDIAKLQSDPAKRADGLRNAVLLFRAALELAPGSAAAQRELGIALAVSASQPSHPAPARLDLLVEAIFRFDRAAALDPSLPDVGNLRALAERDRAAIERQMR